MIGSESESARVGSPTDGGRKSEGPAGGNAVGSKSWSTSPSDGIRYQAVRCRRGKSSRKDPTQGLLPADGGRAGVKAPGDPQGNPQGRKNSIQNPPHRVKVEARPVVRVNFAGGTTRGVSRFPGNQREEASAGGPVGAEGSFHRRRSISISPRGPWPGIRPPGAGGGPFALRLQRYGGRGKKGAK